MKMLSWFKKDKETENTEVVALQTTPMNAPKRDRARRRRGQWNSRFHMAAQSNNLTYDWTSSEPTIALIIQNDLGKLRARSRDAAINSPYMTKYLQMLRDNVAGSQGFNFQVNTLDNKGKPDIAANAVLERSFAEWGQAEHCDVTGKSTFAQIQRQWITNAAMDGEVIVRVLTGAQFGKYGFALQFIEPSLLDEKLHRTFEDGRFIENGIEHDRYGKPLAYHFTQTAVGGKTKVVRIPAAEIIHSFIEKRTGQRRGLPWSHAALYRLHQLESLEDATVVKTRVGASTMAFITTKDGEGGPYDQEDSEGPLMGMEPGTIPRLQEGESINMFDPAFPSVALGPFMEKLLQSIASSLGVNYVNLASDLKGVNYSSIRQGTLEEREFYKGLQRWMVDVFLRPVYERWLSMQLLTNSLTIGGKPLKAELERKYRNVSFNGRRWSWVDPLKEIQAHKIAVLLGEDTLTHGIKESGRDPSEVWAERAAELDTLAELEIPISLDSAAVIGAVDLELGVSNEGIALDVAAEQLAVGKQGAAASIDDALETAVVLNGAQVTSLLQVIIAVAEGTLPKLAAVEVLIAAFAMSRPKAEGMLASVVEGSAAPQEEGETNAQDTEQEDI